MESDGELNTIFKIHLPKPTTSCFLFLYRLYSINKQLSKETIRTISSNRNFIILYFIFYIYSITLHINTIDMLLILWTGYYHSRNGMAISIYQFTTKPYPAYWRYSDDLPKCLLENYWCQSLSNYNKRSIFKN